MTYRTSLPLHPIEDGKPKKRILGGTRTVKKDAGIDYRKRSKDVTIKRKSGVTVEKTKVYGESNRQRVVKGKKGRGASPTWKRKTVSAKPGAKKYTTDLSGNKMKSIKDKDSRGTYDSREHLYDDATHTGPRRLYGGESKSLRSVSKKKAGKPRKEIGRKGGKKTAVHYTSKRLKKQGY